MTPLSRGGSNWPWNLQWLCAEHNIAKGALTDEEYRQKVGLPEVAFISHPYRALFAAIVA